MLFVTSEEWVIVSSHIYGIGLDGAGLGQVAGLPFHFLNARPQIWGHGRGLSLAEAQTTGEVFVGNYEISTAGGSCFSPGVLRFNQNLSNEPNFATVIGTAAKSLAILETTDHGCTETRQNLDQTDAPQIAVWRPNFGQWYGSLFPLNGASDESDLILHRQWGLKGDLPFLANFDGKGSPDLVVWRRSEGNWYLCSNDTAICTRTDFVQFGLSSDIPVIADFDGDTLADFVVWRPALGNWYRKVSRDGGPQIIQQWGLPGDLPLAADFNSDGKDDYVVWRPSTGTWFIKYSSATGLEDPALQGFSKQWGLPGDHPFVGDYDGDGKPNLVVWRPASGIWYVCPSTGGYNCTANGSSQQFGLPQDIPVQGDLDADGKLDLVVWRPSTGTWYVRASSTGQVFLKQFGLPGDVPLGYGPKSLASF